VLGAPVLFAPVLGALLLLAACSTTEGEAEEDGSVTLYTCVSDTTVQPVIDAFEQRNPGSRVRLYRAPTGELNARVASEVRAGGLDADVLWGCDPLTMQDYADQGLLADWQPRTRIPDRYRTDQYVGVAVLYMLAVTHRGVPAPDSWADLTTAAYDGGVALPDPSFAASALGALGYFAESPGYGLDFYAALRRNGAVQVGTPDDVTTGVAEGTYAAGMTIANSAYAAQEAGSPITVSWPRPGGIAIYGPVAVTGSASDPGLAQAFVSYVTSRPGQEVIADAGSYPTLPGVEGPTMPADAPVVWPDWSRVGADADGLLDRYQQVFGG